MFISSNLKRRPRIIKKFFMLGRIIRIFITSILQRRPSILLGRKKKRYFFTLNLQAVWAISYNLENQPRQLPWLPWWWWRPWQCIASFYFFWIGEKNVVPSWRIHGLRTLWEALAFTTRPKIHSHSQIFRYDWSIFCLPFASAQVSDLWFMPSMGVCSPWWNPWNVKVNHNWKIICWL